MSDSSFYEWRAGYGGMGASVVLQVKAIEYGSWRLREMSAELSIQNELFKEACGSNRAITSALVAG